MHTREQVLDMALALPGAASDMPFDEDFDTTVLRHGGSGKWFGILMKVPRGKVGLSGEGVAEILNLKCDPMLSYGLRQTHPDILPAWHMNKQHWITVLLDGSVPDDKVFDLIDMSFMATASAKKKQKYRPPKEWIIPANPNYYDIIHAFEDTDEIDWKQGSGIKTGDTVFMYVGAPVSAIIYKCKVTEADIPYHYEDENLTIKALMKIKLLKRYQPDKFTFDVLKEEYGIFAIRGPRGITNSLSEALK